MNSNNTIFNREMEDFLISKLPKGKVILLVGPRRTGKTFLINKLLSQIKNSLLLNGEDIDTHLLLEKQSASNYKLLFEKYDLIAIDEVQKLKSIGNHLKFLIDLFPE